MKMGNFSSRPNLTGKPTDRLSDTLTLSNFSTLFYTIRSDNLDQLLTMKYYQMKTRLAVAALLMLSSAVSYSADAEDWSNHDRYADANRELTVTPDVVFMGNSITDGWDDAHPEFFTDNNFLCRGIAGQVSSQMLCRFRSDVINLRPKIAVILAGVNDIALNNGPIQEVHIVENIASMVDLARANGIKPVVCSPLPADRFWWNPDFKDAAPKIASLREALRQMCARMEVPFVDYYPALATPSGAIDDRYSDDAIHPNRAGYDIMEPIIMATLDNLLKSADSAPE